MEVDGAVEEEVRVASDTLVIELDQVRHRAHLMILTWVVEPSWADAHIDFAREPLLSVLHAPLCFAVVLGLVLIVHSPVGLASPALLIADPANGGDGTAEDHDVLVVLAQHLRGFLVAVVGLRVDLTGGVSTAVPAVAAVSTVKPVFEELAILRGELVDLCVEDTLIFGLTVVAAIAIPGGEIEAEEQAVLAAGLAQLAYQVAFAVLPRAVFDGIVGGLRGPEAEAIVVLGGEDDPLHPSTLEGGDPLLGVESLGSEGLRGGITVAPLEVVESIEPEVHEGVGFQFLPRYLRWRRYWVDRRRGLGLCRGSLGEAHSQEERSHPNDESFHKE